MSSWTGEWRLESIEYSYLQSQEEKEKTQKNSEIN